MRHASEAARVSVEMNKFKAKINETLFLFSFLQTIQFKISSKFQVIYLTTWSRSLLNNSLPIVNFEKFSGEQIFYSQNTRALTEIESIFSPPFLR